MKKSELYRLAQVAVIKSDMPVVDKLDVLRELMAREDLEKFSESAVCKNTEGVEQC